MCEVKLTNLGISLFGAPWGRLMSSSGRILADDDDDDDDDRNV